MSQVDQYEDREAMVVTRLVDDYPFLRIVFGIAVLFCIAAFFIFQYVLDQPSRYGGVAKHISSAFAALLSKQGEWTPPLVLFLLALTLYSVHRNSRLQLKLLKLDDQGLGLGRQGRLLLDGGITLSWGKVKVVNSIEKGKYRYLDIGTIDGIIYRLRWDNAFEWIDEKTFVAAVRSYAPRVLINIDPEHVSRRPRQIEYTDIWLESFARPVTRARRGLLEQGERLNNSRYQVLSVLSAGGQGTVYLANDYGTDSNLVKEGEADRVVLKEYILPAQPSRDMEKNEGDSLTREAQILSKLNHRQVVKALDFFIEDHRGYLVLEYVQGVTLRDFVHQSGRVPVDEVKRSSIEICQILHYLHTCRTPIIHRDISPDNLILQPDFSIKLVDFTVALQFDPTRVATVVGKQSYLAPEQLKGKPVPQSDLYALGATMFFLITGEDPEPITVSHPGVFVPEIPEELDDIVARATALDVKQRIQSAQQFSSLLSALTL